MATVKTANKYSTKWNLDDIVSLKNWPNLYQEVEADLLTMADWWQRLDPEMPAAVFADFVAFDEAFSQKVTRLYDRPALWEDLDDQASLAKKMKSQASDLLVRASDQTTKVGLWLKGKTLPHKNVLDDKNAKRLFAAVPDLTYVFERQRLAAKHALSEAEETLANQKDIAGQYALLDLRELIETEFEFVIRPRSPKGRASKKPIVVKTRAELNRYIYSDQAVIREAAYRAFLEMYAKNRNKLFTIYQAIVKDWQAMGKRRGFASSISQRNFDNHLPDQVIEVLLEAVTNNRSVFQDFFRYKAAALVSRKSKAGKKLNRFDVYAPLAPIKTAYSYDQGVALVLDTFRRFSPTFASHAEAIIAARHVDVYPDPQKRAGGYCATVGPSITPYILLNHTGAWRDVSTLAHELGHGVHSLYANHHSPSAQSASLPLSETASTLAELLLFERVLAEAKNDVQKKSLLVGKLGDCYATILRQAYFVKFELLAHELISKGATPEDLEQAWLATLKEQFGSSVEVDPLFKYEWLGVPHIVRTPFYCYSYAFGDLLSLGLYARYKQEGKSFVAKIEKILAAGGSRNPDELLKEVGIDITDPQFWQASFGIIKEWVSELKKL